MRKYIVKDPDIAYIPSFPLGTKGKHGHRACRDEARFDHNCLSYWECQSRYSGYEVVLFYVPTSKGVRGIFEFYFKQLMRQVKPNKLRKPLLNIAALSMRKMMVRLNGNLAVLVSRGKAAGLIRQCGTMVSKLRYILLSFNGLIAVVGRKT